MPQHSIHDFSSRFKGGVRANLFECTVAPPFRDDLMQDFKFHCKATSLPVSTIGNIDVPYRGRQLKVPGDRTYADWTVTVFNDKFMLIRGMFELWMGRIQDHWANTTDIDLVTPYGQATVSQLYRTGGKTRTYSFTSLYPTEVAAIDVAWDSNDAVEEYSVTFAVNHWVGGDGDTTGRSAGHDPQFGIELKAGTEGVTLGASVSGTIG